MAWVSLVCGALRHHACTNASGSCHCPCHAEVASASSDPHTGAALGAPEGSATENGGTGALPAPVPQQRAS